MRIARNGLKLILGVLLGLYLTAPVYAFTPSQAPLLSATAVTPNVMLQVDNSGSMNTILLAPGFNPALNWADIYMTEAYSCGNRNRDTCYRRIVVANGSSNYVFVGDMYRGSCAVGSYEFYVNSTGGSAVCIALVDPVGSGLTRYPLDYLSYLVGEVSAGRSVAGIPTQTRLNTAISVAKTLVQNNRALRIGLAAYNPPKTGDSGPGGSIKQPVADLSPVTATGVTQQTADTNYSNLITSINTLTAEANTPLAETYYQVTRYFRGMTPSPTYTNAPATFTSPIQYRCQKNYGVVITDGLPTYDRTFPTDDPDDPNHYLPNWDRINNDGPGTDAEGGTLYLDDIAKFAYDIDLRKDTATSTGDLTGKKWDSGGFPVQRLSTYTIGFTLGDQMLIDAANDTHGHGKYFQTSDSADLTAALNLALSDIYAKAGSGGGGTSNTSTLQDGTRFYQTLYDPTDWHGTIRAFSVNSTTGELGSILWTTDSSITSGAGTTFESWNTLSNTRINLDYTLFAPAQQTQISTGLPTGVTGVNLIDWTKGTANASLRTRTKLLGDVINSPLVAAQPNEKTASDLTGYTSYSSYLTAKSANMINSLLVNANDGFFNVVNAESSGNITQGVRRYAYMPSTVLPYLSTIAATSYTSNVHRFTVDGQISVFDTQAGKDTAWRTVAFGGTGAGGKGYFAVKLFEGTSNTVSALWDIKAPDTSDTTNKFNNLGYAYSKPDVARMADGTGIMVIGNSYGSFTGRASLYVINANTGAFIREIQTPTVVANETDNGLSSVKLVVDSQNIVQAAYAGDLKGRMWKFDLSDASAANWKVAFNSTPLFTAPRGASQAITVQPLVVDHPLNGKLIYFGTGKFSETADKQTTELQAFYAIWDASGGSGNIVEGNLQAQAINSTVTGAAATYFTTTRNDVDWATKKGWYLPLAAPSSYQGERVIYSAYTTRGRIIFTTAMVNSSDPCESTGTGRLFELDATTGGMLTYQVLDTNGDGLINGSDSVVSSISIGTGIPVLAAIVAGTGGNNDNKYINTGADPVRLLEKGGNANVYQRIMWRQIQ